MVPISTVVGVPDHQHLCRTIHELREIPDERLIELHDEQARNTFVGISYYLDEYTARSMNYTARATCRRRLKTDPVSTPEF